MLYLNLLGWSFEFCPQNHQLFQTGVQLNVLVAVGRVFSDNLRSTSNETSPQSKGLWHPTYISTLPLTSPTEQDSTTPIYSTGTRRHRACSSPCDLVGACELRRAAPWHNELALEIHGTSSFIWPHIYSHQTPTMDPKSVHNCREDSSTNELCRLVKLLVEWWGICPHGNPLKSPNILDQVKK